MALSQKEIEIANYGKANGKSIEETQQAILKYRAMVAQTGGEQAVAPESATPPLSERLKNLAKGVVEPVATIVARPIQAGAELLGASEEDVNRVTKDLAGDWVAPVPHSGADVGKDIVRGLETVALGLGGPAIKGGTMLAKEGAALAKTGAEIAAQKGGEIGAKARTAVIGKPKSEIDQIIEATSGVKDKKARISTLERSGLSGGAEKGGLLGGIESSGSKYDIARANAVKDVVKPGANPVDNIKNINNKITEIVDTEVLPGLRSAGKISGSQISAKAPGWSVVSKRLKDINPGRYIKGDKTLKNTYESVRQVMLDELKKQPHTAEGFWKARKNFDDLVEKEFGDVIYDSEKNTAIKRAVFDMRKEINKMIGEVAPEYSSQMEKLTHLYDARFNIAEQYQNLLDKGGWKAFEALNPKAAATLKASGAAGVGGVGLGVLGSF